MANQYPGIAHAVADAEAAVDDAINEVQNHPNDPYFEGVLLHRETRLQRFQDIHNYHGAIREV